ncbi:histidine phosphatase family protein [Aliidiomarina sanyensis]|uniref:Histidine phosphatase family protein n=1 Tax=Aliidiomarina sanyensis TaxID=1249555 RepID=A0A432WR74_9GAMM|nr:histidine phosphatase family protein [Aliidiomarina sanyensis]RUO36274.1 histidine phosphatase family protein [Aliidiomarina sanyensis]
MPLVSLVRHGQASFGAADYDQLSDLGYQQLEHLGAQLRERDEHVDVFVRGTLRRHAQSLDALMTGYGTSGGATDVVVDAAWNEFDHRAVMRALGKAQPELRSLFATDGTPLIDGDSVLALFMQSVERWQNDEHDADYEESWSAFVARVERAWSQLQARFDASRILVLTSGGPISLSASASLGLPSEHMMKINAQLVNSGISRFLCRSQRNTGPHRKLLSLNEHSHVSGRHQHLLTYR